MAFLASDKNLGGRKIILDQLSSHAKALQKVRPIISELAPKAHVDQGGERFGDNPYYFQVYQTPNVPLGLRKPRHFKKIMLGNLYGKRRTTLEGKLKKDPDYAETRYAFKKIHSLKTGDIDTKPPRTFHLSSKLTENRRPSQFTSEEHIKNLASLHRRIKSIGSVTVP